MQSGPRGRALSPGLRRVVAIGSALAVVGSAVGFFSDGAAAAPKKLTPIEQGMAFYRGKTLTFVAPTTAGSPYDVESRAFALEIGSYLGATVNVVNYPTGNTIPGQDALAAAPPNGLTIGYYPTGGDFYNQITNTPGVDFNVKNVTFLGSVPNPPIILATQSTTPYTSFKTLLAATAAAPAKILIGTGGATTEALLMVKEFGIHAQFISGYSNTTAQITGFLRGDGPLATVAFSGLQPEIAAGTVRALVIGSVPTTVPPKGMTDYSLIQSVPTIPALIAKYPPKTAAEKEAAKFQNLVSGVPVYVLGAPAGVPSDLVDALDAAVKFAARTTYVKTRIAAVGNLPGYIKPSVAKSSYVGANHLATEIEAYLVQNPL